MQAHLISLDGKITIPLKNDVIVVGRKRGMCDVFLDHGSISKCHCLIVKTDGLLLVRDLGSTNGTLVNGQRISRGALLPGDELSFASLKFQVQFGAGLPGDTPGLPAERTDVMPMLPAAEAAIDIIDVGEDAGSDSFDVLPIPEL